MGISNTKQEVQKPVENINSSGFHIFELHLPTAGAGVTILILILLLAYIFKRLCVCPRTRQQHSFNPTTMSTPPMLPLQHFQPFQPFLPPPTGYNWHPRLALIDEREQRQYRTTSRFEDVTEEAEYPRQTTPTSGTRQATNFEI